DTSSSHLGERGGAGDGGAGGGRRSDRGVRRGDGPSRPRDPARRAPDDDGPRVPGGARRGRRRPLRAVIAPARVAAYETLLAVAAGRADLSAALARARTKLTDARDR